MLQSNQGVYNNSHQTWDICVCVCVCVTSSIQHLPADIVTKRWYVVTTFLLLNFLIMHLMISFHSWVFLSRPGWLVLVLLSPIIIASADSPCVSSILSSSHDSSVTRWLSHLSSSYSGIVWIFPLIFYLPFQNWLSSSVCFSLTLLSFCLLNMPIANVLITVLCLYTFIWPSWSL